MDDVAVEKTKTAFLLKIAERWVFQFSFLQNLIILKLMILCAILQSPE